MAVAALVGLAPVAAGATPTAELVQRDEELPLFDVAPGWELTQHALFTRRFDEIRIPREFVQTMELPEAEFGWEGTVEFRHVALPDPPQSPDGMVVLETTIVSGTTRTDMMDASDSVHCTHTDMQGKITYSMDIAGLRTVILDRQVVPSEAMPWIGTSIRWECSARGEVVRVETPEGDPDFLHFSPWTFAGILERLGFARPEKKSARRWSGTSVVQDGLAWTYKRAPRRAEDHDVVIDGAWPWRDAPSFTVSVNGGPPRTTSGNRTRQIETGKMKLNRPTGFPSDLHLEATVETDGRNQGRRRVRRRAVLGGLPAGLIDAGTNPSIGLVDISTPIWPRLAPPRRQLALDPLAPDFGPDVACAMERPSLDRTSVQAIPPPNWEMQQELIVEQLPAPGRTSARRRWVVGIEYGPGAIPPDIRRLGGVTTEWPKDPSIWFRCAVTDVRWETEVESERRDADGEPIREFVALGDHLDHPMVGQSVHWYKSELGAHAMNEVFGHPEDDGNNPFAPFARSLVDLVERLTPPAPTELRSGTRLITHHISGERSRRGLERHWTVRHVGHESVRFEIEGRSSWNIIRGGRGIPVLDAPEQRVFDVETRFVEYGRAAMDPSTGWLTHLDLEFVHAPDGADEPVADDAPRWHITLRPRAD
ncbi:MAG: hypothetical protein AB8G96_08085 [Phycisphaerales bacterium]